MQSTRWCFTLNNYTEDEYTTLSSNTNAYVYLVIGKEVGEAGTPHLQGFIIFSSRKRLNSVKQIVGARAHCEAARGSSQQARVYCQKDGNFAEFGEFPITREGQGRRSDLETFFTWATEYHGQHGCAPPCAVLLAEHPHIYLKYPRLPEVLRLKYGDASLVPVDAQLRDWQLSLFAELELPADDRKIHFICDEQGGKGKTFFQKYCVSKLEGVQIMSAGKRDDLAYMVKREKRIFLFNVPRGGLQFLSYVLLEQLKDRMVFSPKYESAMKILDHTPHVIVFTNEGPDYTKLTGDRYVTTWLSPNYDS